jgi:wyosine [tRNA(Phe)-imidazoG37] synthetase (radical SAM superfamily)
MTEVVPNCIYGPVRSWRLGMSLGVDLLCVDSICSFQCVYCQLGKINRVTSARDIFVPTAKVIEDLQNSDWQSADVITFSGSGEPTLAQNLGEVIDKIKEITGKPIIILTNSTLLYDKQVRAEISRANQIFCKLDAWSDESLARIDRPHEGISLKSVIDGIKLLRQEFKGFLAIQTMILRQPSNADLEKLAEILREIKPDEVQLNLPLRPIPHEFLIETRGNEVKFDDSFIKLKTISPEELEKIRRALADLTGLPIKIPRR